MKTKEYLSWILDNKKDSYSNEDKIKKILNLYTR